MSASSARRDDLAADLVGPAGVIGQRVDGGRQVLPQHGGDRLAGVEAFERRDFIGVLFHQVDQPEQDLSALGRAHGAPGSFEGASRRSDRPVNVGFVAFRDRGDDLLGGRIEGLEVRPERDGTCWPSISSRRDLLAETGGTSRE